MIFSTANAATPSGIRGGEFYVTGGTLRPDAPSYVDRQADRDLCEGMLNGEFCYVLTSRQMGKSSLMVRAVQKLRAEGVAVAVLDLTAIGQNLTIDQWYDGLISRLGQQLDLEDELLDFWEAHPELGPLQRWVTALETVVLERIPGRVVVFVDEIDIVRSLPFSTDEFFAAIREAYNRRSREPRFNRLAFGLLGVATPTDLIRDTRMTPFNIGRRIELHDFTAAEAEPLARGLGPDEATSHGLLARVLFWTGGHPYLTQRLCRAVAESLRPPPGDEPPIEPGIPPVIPTPNRVDEIAHRLFLTRQARERDDNLIFVRERILRSDQDVASLLHLYRRVRRGDHVASDETNPLISILRLSGVTRTRDGALAVRNRIYWHAFDLGWVQTNMPAAEVRRQRAARRRGVAMGLSIALFLLLVYLFMWPLVTRYRETRLAWKTATELESTYRALVSYKDDFETTVEIGVGGHMVPTKASGKLIFERPNKADLTMKSDFSTPEIQVRVTSDGRNAAVYSPTVKQFRIMDAAGTASPFDLPSSVSRQLGPMRLMPLYRMFLEPEAAQRFLKDAENIQFTGTAELDGRKMRVLTWEHPAEALLDRRRGRRELWPPPPGQHFMPQLRKSKDGKPMALERPVNPPPQPRVPVTAWIASDHTIAQIRLDFSNWAPQLVGSASSAPATGLIITEKHKHVETSLRPAPETAFRFVPGPESQPVADFNLPEPDLSSRATVKRELAELLPPRLSHAPPNLIDLTTYLNAPLSKTWHPGVAENSLSALPPGLLQFGNLSFDVRGIVQLSGGGLSRAGGKFPQKIVGIKVQQKCRDLHFLQACAWKAPDGTRVGNYLVRYVDGESIEVPLVYGQHLRDWCADFDPSADVPNATIVWSALNNARIRIRLFQMVWENPRPEVTIASIDFVSAMSEAAPFLLAITAEP